MGNQEFETAVDMVQFIADNYARAAGKIWRVKPVSVDYLYRADARPKDCFNNAYRYMQKSGVMVQYVIGFVVVCGAPLEHAWVRQKNRYIDTTLKSGEYIKVVEFDEAEILNFVIREQRAPTLYDATKFPLI